MELSNMSDQTFERRAGIDRRNCGDRRQDPNRVYDYAICGDNKTNVINNHNRRNYLSQSLPLSGFYSVSVVIPTLNEEKNLLFLLPLIPTWVKEIIIVDGYSTDRTRELAISLHPKIRVIYQSGPGKGSALRSGFAEASGDIIVMLDADGSHDPSEIPLFVSALLAGADFAKGSRFIQGGGTDDMEWYRRLGNWCLKLMVGLSFGGKYSDLCYGYNAFQSKSLDVLNLDADGFEIETQINIRALKNNLKIKEVPSFEAERMFGTSYLKTIPDGWRVLKTIVRETFNGQSEFVDQYRKDVSDSRSSDWLN